MSTLHIEDLWRWYYSTQSILENSKHEILSGGHLDSQIFNDFSSMTASEVKNEFDTLATEVELGYILSLVASAEAAFRKDFETKADKGKRNGKNLKDRFYQIRRDQSQKGKFIKLETHIIDGWKTYGNLPNNAVLSQLKAALKLRHWIAHGRNWTFKSGSLDFEAVFLIVRDALQECKLI